MSGPLSVIGPSLADHAEAVVREAVSNAVRHSGATTLTITVSVDDNLTISVLDNGSGISESTRRSGLANLESRAREAGGELVLARAAGGGTRLAWWAPLP